MMIFTGNDFDERRFRLLTVLPIDTDGRWRRQQTMRLCRRETVKFDSTD
ncbi:hypothetical protein [Haloferax mucosum]|nr:hypothetical protein [Haloferax mucosum]